MIAAGALDRRVVVEAPVLSQDTVGGPVIGWATLATVWAKVYDLSGHALEKARQSGSAVDRRVTLRYRTDITGAQRLRFEDGRTARITFVREVGRREMLEIDCELING